jgi:hypothetical protein
MPSIKLIKLLYLLFSLTGEHENAHTPYSIVFAVLGTVFKSMYVPESRQ